MKCISFQYYQMGGFAASQYSETINTRYNLVRSPGNEVQSENFDCYLFKFDFLF